MDPAPISVEAARHRLAHTPEILSAVVSSLSPTELHGNEGPETWSPYQVVGHLVYAERGNWIPRLERALVGRKFDPFDRFRHLDLLRDTPLPELLAEFASKRAENLVALDAFALDAERLARRTQHPEFGDVTVAQLLGTWVLHDWAHLGQITRTVAKGLGPYSGPWQAYFSILKR